MNKHSLGVGYTTQLYSFKVMYEEALQTGHTFIHGYY